MSLPLCNYPFGQKYVERCEETLKFLIGVVKKRIELAEARLAGMDKHWQEYSKAFSPKTTAKPRTPGKKVEKNHER